MHVVRRGTNLGSISPSPLCEAQQQQRCLACMIGKDTSTDQTRASTNASPYSLQHLGENVRRFVSIGEIDSTHSVGGSLVRQGQLRVELAFLDFPTLDFQNLESTDQLETHVFHRGLESHAGLTMQLESFLQ